MAANWIPATAVVICALAYVVFEGIRFERKRRKLNTFVVSLSRNIDKDTLRRLDLLPRWAPSEIRPILDWRRSGSTR